MKSFKNTILKIAAVALIAPMTLGLTSCKKGEDDPALSLKSRTARMAQFWTLEDVRVNGNTEDQGSTTTTWDIDKDGTITAKLEGVIAGVQTSQESDGVWEFRSDKEDLYINIDGDTEQFTIDRLASKELQLRQIEDGDVYEYDFEKR